MKRRMRAWWPAVSWALLIAVATTIPIPESPVDTGLPLDKVAHFGLYAVFGWTLGRGLRISGRTIVPAYWLTWLGGIIFAAIDESHQGLVPTRVPSVADWAVDVLGLSLGLLLYALLITRRKTREEIP